MSQKDPTIDDILRELELADSAQSDSSPTGLPDVDALVQDLIEERQQPGIDPHSGKELPTRVFLRSKKKRPPAEPAAAEPLEALLSELGAAPAADAQKAPPSAPSPAPKVPSPDEAPKVQTPPAANPSKPEAPEAEPFEKTPPPSAPKAAPPKKQAPPSEDETAYITGPISIDIDAIRAGTPTPKPIPAQKIEPEEQSPPEEDPASGKPQTAPRSGRNPLAPCFRRAAAGKDPNQPGELEAIFRRISASAQTRGWILLLLFVFSLVLVFLMDQSRHAEAGWIPSRWLMGLLTGLGIGAGAAALPVIGSGLLSLCKLEENRDTPPALAWLITLAQTLTLTIWPKGFIHPHIHCYLPLGILLLAAAFLGRLLTAHAGLRSLRFLHGQGDKYVPHLVEDKRLASELSRGLPNEGEPPAVNRRSAAITDLAASALGTDSSDRMSRVLVLIGLSAGAAAALIGLICTSQKHFAVTLFSAVNLLFASIPLVLLTASPVSRTARLMEKQRGMVSGEAGAERYRQAGSVLLSAPQLIPSDFISLAAIKTFEGTRLDDVLVDAASVLRETDSILTDLFTKITGQKKELLRQADNVELEEGCGISGWVDGKRILIGNRAMMAAYDVRIPSKEYERRYTSKGHDLVYLAASGELAAIFVLTLHVPLQVSEAVQSLADNGFGLIVHSVDSLLTPERLGRLFDVDPAQIKVLPHRLIPYAGRLSSDVRAKQALAVNDGSISGLTGCLIGARQLRSMISLNRVLAITSIVLGCMLLLIFSLLDAMRYLSPLLLCGYALTWMVFSWLLQKFFR